MVELGEFLRQGGSRQRAAGIWDCCTLPADWAVASGWRDPMAAWRGAYASEAEAGQLIHAAGGLDVLFGEGMAAAGIPEVQDGSLIAGDIAVVEILGEQAGTVYAGKRWAFVAERGLAFGSVNPEHLLRVWRVSHG